MRHAQKAYIKLSKKISNVSMNEYICIYIVTQWKEMKKITSKLTGKLRLSAISNT